MSPELRCAALYAKLSRKTGARISVSVDEGKRGLEMRFAFSWPGKVGVYRVSYPCPNSSGLLAALTEENRVFARFQKSAS